MVRRGSADGEQTMTVRFGRKGGPLVAHRAVIKTDESGTKQLTLDPIGPLSPYVLADFEQHRGEPLMLTFVGESAIATKLAFLAWGFLALFAKFGYAYVLAPCSRRARAALIGRRATYGEAFFIRFGDIPTPLEELVVGLPFVARPKEDGAGHELEYIGLGVSVGHTVVVCLPVGYDPEGKLIRKLESEADETGQLTHTVLNLPFEQLFEMSAGESFLNRNQEFHLTNADGSLKTLIGTSTRDAERTLATARAPHSARRSARKGAPLRGDWERDATPLPSAVARRSWVRTIRDDIVDRLRGETAGQAASASLAAIDVSSPPEEFLVRAETTLEPHLASHVRDSYGLFVRGTDPEVVESLRGEDVLGKVKALLEAAGHEDASLSFTEVSLSAERSVVAYALVVAEAGRELIIGSYYSAHTALLAAEVLLPRWLSGANDRSPLPAIDPL
jgi:hypothetical protein